MYVYIAGFRLLTSYLCERETRAVTRRGIQAEKYSTDKTVSNINVVLKEIFLLIYSLPPNADLRSFEYLPATGAGTIPPRSSHLEHVIY